MDTVTRSKRANDAKASYIKNAKKSAIVKKINRTARSSKLNEMIAKDESEDSHSDEEFVLEFSESESEPEVDRPKRGQRKYGKKEKEAVQVPDKEVLKLQREIESLKLKQIKQAKQPVKEQKPQKEPKVQALKEKLLVQF